ncbi:MAG TPA: hypothetical protein VFY13_07425, partial [Luteolibacter sp.]|nr:hypothetical protein [Luteolibacter sp.]
MSRPWVIWSILIVCGLLIAGAMGWLTQRTLTMERQRIEVEARSKVEERVRLALSRMDTAASALLVIENQRPPEHYRAFYEPKVLFTNTLQSVSSSLVTQPSPLLSEPPEFVKLHFEVWAHDELTSPQLPTGNQRDLAEASGIERAKIDEAAQRVVRLRELLSVPVRGQARLREGAVPGDNLDRMISACLPSSTAWNAVQPTEELTKQVSWGNLQLQEVVANSYAQPQAESAYQQDLTSADRGKRMEVYNEVQTKAAQGAVNSSFKRSKPQAKDEVAQKLAVQEEAALEPLLVNPSSLSQWAAPAPSAQGGAAPADDAANKARASAPVAASRDQVQDEQQGRATSAAEIVDLEVTPFRPVWVEGELMAIRQVRSEQGVRYQGFWIDAEALRQSLLSRVSDLLPEARLNPVAALVAHGIGEIYQNGSPQPDDRSLVTLPWRLDEGIDVRVGLTGFTPLYASLGAGWLAVLLAMLAAAVLVQGVLRMSERRAAFVSSVTHELRTPLTTFQLYSDLLAEG